MNKSQAGLPPLQALKVIEISNNAIAAGYASKMLADAGAEVVKLELGDGDDLRHWSAAAAAEAADSKKTGALFRFLYASKKSICLSPQEMESREILDRLLADVDVVIEQFGNSDTGAPCFDVEAILADHPRLSWVSISNFGSTGPWAGRAANEFTLQAWSGSTAARGEPHLPPLATGGRSGEWVAGAFAAVAALVASLRSEGGGAGSRVDLSILESIILTSTVYRSLYREVGAPEVYFERHREIPSIEPTKDGVVGICTVLFSMWEDFCRLIGHEEWLHDEELIKWVGRYARADELRAAIAEWLADKTTAEAAEILGLMRIPVSPVGNGRDTPEFEHFKERGVYRPSADNEFIQPRPPYQFSSIPFVEPGLAPSVGQHNGLLAAIGGASRPNAQEKPSTEQALPLAGLVVTDLAGAWAGSFGSQMLAMLGAKVIKVESPTRMDPARLGSNKPFDEDQFWEYDALFQGSNAGKQAITLDLNQPEGLEVLRKLIARSDILLENFSPRVMENFGLTYEAVKAINPEVIMVRMPAFGITGPWRDRVGFAQTQEQASGLAWVTGFEDQEPMIPRGLCDPLTGLHAVVGVLIALVNRQRTGEGQQVEASMAECALNIAAEQVVEYSDTGFLIGRMGNRAAWAAPQNIYPAKGDDQWLALSIETDQQWRQLKQALGNPGWAEDNELDNIAGRRAAQDEIDRHLQAYFAERTAQQSVDLLWPLDIPVAPVMDSWVANELSQVQQRGFYHSVDHALLGSLKAVPGLPFTMSGHSSAWVRSAAPLFGEHNQDILKGFLGMNEDELAALSAAKVIADRPVWGS